MSHEGHGRSICGTCGTVIAQCRCADKDKPTRARAGRCDACRGKTIHQVVTMRIAAGLRTMPRTSKEEATLDQVVMEAVCGMMASEVSRQIQDALKAEGMARELGFALILFDFGDIGESVSYASNANREDFVRLLDELRGKLAATMSATQTRTPS